MKFFRFFSSNWFIGIFLTLAVLAASLFELYPLQILEYKFYDLLSQLGKEQTPDNIAIVTIDDKSINAIGPWPWPRTYIADIVTLLSGYGAAVIGIDIMFPGKEFNAGLEEIQSIRESIEKEKSHLKNSSVKKIYDSLKESEEKSDNNKKFAASIRSSKIVVLPVFFAFDKHGNSGDDGADSLLNRNSVALKSNSTKASENILYIMNNLSMFKDDRLLFNRVTVPSHDFARYAFALGHSNHIADRDGTVRNEHLLIPYRNSFYPSFGLQVAARYLNYNIKRLENIEDSKGLSGLKLGNLSLPTDKEYRMLIRYAKHNTGQKDFPYYSFSDVINKNMSEEAFKKKIVLIGPSAEGIASFYKTSLNAGAAGVDIKANVIENILNSRHIMRPSWALALETGVILYFGIFISFIIPRVRRSIGLLILCIFLSTWCGVAILLFFASGYWFKMLSPVILSVIGYGAIISKKVLLGAEADAENIESNKMLGLSFQSQGMLDMAFEKFMKCPVKDDAVKSLIYNLGLDFERKRMFNKAVAVYEYILKSGKYKDIKDRIKRLRTAGESILQTTGASGDEGTMILEDTATKPTLGRYEILKELGRGAMGTVYLGRDPKINREVAVKALKYDKIDNSEIAEFKERFFKEAEAAGTLSHPNIVTIYDVGEEHDMAYIAMELLNGKDLSSYAAKKNLLKVEEVLKIISSVANALDYAHTKGIVHRDIKPANIMLLENGVVKVTDFGIAKIMETSMTSTQTGTILGTPNYMSPEQLAGDKVDGRSDLFSLGGVFYELLTGQKPFSADSIAALMHNISTAQYTPLEEVVPDIPDCCVQIIDRLLAKSLKKRYKTGGAVVNDINRCLEELN